MAKNLIVVESPAKARTIVKYLGADFHALASYGHVRDLRPKSGAIDPENDFHMHYELIDRNRKHVDAIARELKSADALYLATDPDREGEAISWHLYELLKERELLNGKAVHRVEFYEFTRNAIRDAIEHPRELSDNLINAQQARRALDYLVGFNLSPLLWKKVRRGLSAGRVQTPALRLIVEREEEIERFIRREYWSLEAQLDAAGQGFTARLARLDGNKLDQFDIVDEAGATSTRERLLTDAGGVLTVTSVERAERRRNPAPPFTTSTLQQEASRKLGFGAQRTMRIAQQLYEGIDIEGERVGLITYMRTDAVNLAGEAIGEIRRFVAARYGEENLPASPRAYRNKSKNAQEAHEAIRPTSVDRTPDAMGSALSTDQRRLYELIWKRTLACQMIHATLETVAIELVTRPGGGDVFRATGSTIVNPGFLAVYEEGQDDRSEADDGQPILPALAEGDRVDLADILARQHFTEPPPRYSEASLVKTLEAYGIGRPSTYASIIATLLAREYVELDSRRFRPTEVGRVVAKFLSEHFERYVDYDFTARLEDELDAVSRGEKEWVPLMREFWEPFRDRILEKEQSVSRAEARREREIGTDPESGKPITVRMGRFGPFAQIGTADGDEKPRFASLRPGQNLDTITLEQALKLFQLPRDLGATEDGEELAVNIGRFGPYVRFGSRFASLHKDDDPYTIDRERALELVQEKKTRDAERFIKAFEDEGIQVLKGRWGPYVTDGKRNARVPKETEPTSLTLQDCQTLLENAPARGRGATRKTQPAAANDDAPQRRVAAKRTPARKKTTTRRKTTARKKTATKKAPARTTRRTKTTPGTAPAADD